MTHRSHRGRRLAGLVAVSVALLSSACGSDAAPSTTPVAASSSATASTPATAAASPAAGAPSSAGAAAPTALPVTTFAEPGDGAKVAVVRAPSGNIICDFSVDDSHAGCGVKSLATAEGSKWWIELRGTAPKRRERDDAPFSGNVNGDVQVVEYGTTVATGHYACRSEQAAMTCWNTTTGKGARLARSGIDLVTMPKGAVAVAGAAATGTASDAGIGAAGAGDYDALLSAQVPASLVPSKRAGRLADGVYAFNPEDRGAKVWLVNGDHDAEWKKRVAFADVTGDARKEAVVLLGRSNGGVPWADGVVVYGADGGILWSWDTSEAGGEPRGNCTFTRLTATSVDVGIGGTDGSGPAGAQRGESTYRLAKGDGSATWQLVSKR